MANTINVSEHEQEYDVTSFYYSKHQAENELRLLEAKMKEQGILFDDVETRKSTTSGTLKPKSAIGSDRTSTGYFFIVSHEYHAKSSSKSSVSLAIHFLFNVVEQSSRNMPVAQKAKL